MGAQRHGTYGFYAKADSESGLTTRYISRKGLYTPPFNRTEINTSRRFPRPTIPGTKDSESEKGSSLHPRREEYRAWLLLRSSVTCVQTLL